MRSSKVNRKGQEQIKEWFKNTFDLDKPQLEREYSRSNKEILYEIFYNVPEDLYVKLKVLSRVA